MHVPKLSLPFRCRLTRLGSSRSSNKKFQELVLADLKREVVHAFAGVGRLTFTAATTTTIGTRNTIACDELLVARMHDVTMAAAAVTEGRLGHVLTRDHDALATFHVGDAAFLHRFLDRFLDVAPVALQETLSIDRALVRLFRRLSIT